MPKYAYEATDANGQVVLDYIDAPSPEVAKVMLRNKGLSVTRCEPYSDGLPRTPGGRMLPPGSPEPVRRERPVSSMSGVLVGVVAVLVVVGGIAGGVYYVVTRPAGNPVVGKSGSPGDGPSVITTPGQPTPPSVPTPQRPARVVPMHENAPDKNGGLFVGINEFTRDEGLTPLSFAVNDAVETAYTFVYDLKLIPAANCQVVINGTCGDAVKPHLERLRNDKAQVFEAGDRSSILKGLDALQELQPHEKSGIVVVSLSTHGIFRDGTPFVIPSDGLRTRLKDTALPLTEFYESMRLTKAGHQLMFVDACQERVVSKSVVTSIDPAAAMTPGFLSALEQTTGQAVLSSCSPDECSFEDSNAKHGVFTNALLAAIRVQAAPDKDKLVRLDAVITATQQAMSEWGKKSGKKQTIHYAGEERARHCPLATRP